MKKIFVLLSLVALSMSLCAQDEKVDGLLATISGKWSQEGSDFLVQNIIEVKDKTKDEIYNGILEFLTKSYRDANSVIQTKDKESGLIIGKGLSTFYVQEVFKGSAVKQSVPHIFKAEIKDGKVRLTLSSSTVEWHSPAYSTGGMYIAAQDGEYPLTNCYPIILKKNKTDNRRSGYVFYKSINSLIDLSESSKTELLKIQSIEKSNDNW
jgi:hypothetical protein